MEPECIEPEIDAELRAVECCGLGRAAQHSNLGKVARGPCAATARFHKFLSVVRAIAARAAATFSSKFQQLRG